MLVVSFYELLSFKLFNLVLVFVLLKFLLKKVV